MGTVAFHQIFIVETKRFVGSFVNVILPRQTCGQRSSMAAESKRYFPGWICYMFLISRFRGDWDLGQCSFWVLAKREPLRNGDFRKKTKRVLPAESRDLALRSLFEGTQKLHWPGSQSPLHFDFRNEATSINHIANSPVKIISQRSALLERWLQVFGYWFLVCYAATQLATQLPQRRIQVVCRNKVAQKHLTESNGTPAMDLGHMNVVLK